MWVGVIVRNSGWLVKFAWCSGVAIHWSVGTVASWSCAVHTIWAVVSVAFWKWSGSFHDNWYPCLFQLDVGGLSATGLGQSLLALDEMIWLAFHNDVLAEILVSDHAGSEEHVISDA